MKPPDPLANLARATINAMRANTQLRAATAAASSARAAARRRQSPPRRVPSSPSKRRNSPPKPKSASPPKRRNSPPKRRNNLPAASMNAANYAVAHAINPATGEIVFFLPEVPSGRKYNFSHRLPWNQVKAGVVNILVPRR